MNKFFDLLDKYKYGLLAAIAVYVAVYMYLIIDTYEYRVPYDPFFDGSTIEIPEEIEIKTENIDLANLSNEPVKNAVRDKNDKREQKDENWSQNSASSKNVEQQVKDLEQQYRDATGEAQKRAAIQEKIDRLNKEKEDLKNKAKNNKKDPSKGGENAPKGNVMVEFQLDNRTPYENNMYWVRNPGYTCQQGSAGKVVIRIKVNQNGNVTSAIIESTGGANACMQEQAIKYAKLSRFNYSGNAPSNQEGVIYYTFVAG